MMANASVSNDNQPTGRKRRKAKGPPVPNPLPDWPPLPSGLEVSADDLEEENGEGKRLRSTSTTPRSEPLRARDPFEYECSWGRLPQTPHFRVDKKKIRIFRILCVFLTQSDPNCKSGKSDRPALS